MAKYYYNEEENSFYVACNFTPKKVPNGYVKISKEQYDEMNKAAEEETSEEETE